MCVVLNVGNFFLAFMYFWNFLLFFMYNVVVSTMALTHAYERILCTVGRKNYAFPRLINHQQTKSGKSIKVFTFHWNCFIFYLLAPAFFHNWFLIGNVFKLKIVFCNIKAFDCAIITWIIYQSLYFTVVYRGFV